MNRSVGVFQEEKDFDVVQDDNEQSGDEGGVEAETSMTLRGWVSFTLHGLFHKLQHNCSHKQ